MRLTPVRLVAIFAALLLIAACGGDGTDEEATTTTTTQAGPETTVASEPVDSEPADDPGAGSDDGGGITTVCLDATQAMAAAINAYTTGLAGAMGGSLDDESLQLSAGQLQAMADAAPDEIKDDLEVIANELEAFYTALGEAGYEPGVAPTPEQIAQLSALAEVVDQEVFDEASDNINAWFEANC
jgi:hypothetical protein